MGRGKGERDGVGVVVMVPWLRWVARLLPAAVIMAPMKCAGVVEGMKMGFGAEKGRTVDFGR